MSGAQKIDWDEQEFTEVRPDIYEATVHTPQLTATLYRYGGGSRWEEHQPPQDQMTTVLEGAVDFVVDGQPVRLEAGQLAALPGGTPHSATVPEGGAVTLNVFTHRDAPVQRRLDGKTFMVTGAGTGFGAALSVRAAHE